MMRVTARRAAAALVVAAVVLAAGACSGGEPEPTLKDRLPGDTQWYVAVRDVPALMTTLDELGLLDPLVQALLVDHDPSTPGSLSEIYTEFIVPLEGVFAGELVLAGRGPLSVDGRQSLVLIAEVGGNEAALDRYLATVIYPYLDEELGVGPELVEAGPDGPGNGLKLTLLHLDENEPDEVVVFALDRGVLMVADDVGVLMGLAAARDGPRGDGLSGDAAYKDVARVLGQPDMEVLFRDLPPAQGEGAAGADGEGTEASPLGPMMKLVGLDRARALGAGITFGPEGVMGVVRVTTDGPPTGVFGLFARERGASKLLRYAPKGTDMFIAANVGDLAGLYADVTQLIDAFVPASGDRIGAIEDGSVSEAAEAEAGTADEAPANIDLERDVLPGLGGEVAVAVKFPRLFGIAMAGLVEVKDREAVERLLNELFEQASRVEDSRITIERSTFKDVEITSLGTFPVPELPFMKVTPAYALVDDVLVFGSHPDVVKVIVNVARGKDDITHNEEFRAMADALPGKPALTFYMDLVGVGRFSGAGGNLKTLTDREHLGVGITCGGDESGVTLGWWCRIELLKLIPTLSGRLLEGFGGL